MLCVEENFDLKESSFVLMKTQRAYSDTTKTKLKQGTVWTKYCQVVYITKLCSFCFSFFVSLKVT